MRVFRRPLARLRQGEPAEVCPLVDSDKASPAEHQLLRLTDARWDALLAGKKTDTIRIDEGLITPGFLVYESFPSLSQHTVVLVTAVMNVPLRDVLLLTSDKERRSDGDTLLRLMRAHYPDIHLDTQVDYIRHLTPAETATQFASEVRNILSAFATDS